MHIPEYGHLAMKWRWVLLYTKIYGKPFDKEDGEIDVFLGVSKVEVF